MMTAEAGAWSTMRLVAIATTVTLVAGALVVLDEPAGAAEYSHLFMAPGTAGRTCSASDPCGSLAVALARSSDGGTVVAAGGEYGEQKVPSANGPAKSVTIRSASGQNAVFRKTTVDQPGVTFDSVTFRAGLILTQGRATIRNVHVIDGTILVRADDVTITDSLIEGGYGRDGINIAGYPNPVQNVTVRRTTVRNIGAHTKDRPEHPDCIQVFDARNITLEQNNLYNCFNTGIIFSPGAYKGVENVLIRANFVQGCLSVRQQCGDGGGALDLRLATAKNITVTQNTFRGTVRLPYNPTITATRNIVSFLSISRPCTTSLSNSLIGSYSNRVCKNGVPGATNTTNSGNQRGSVNFINANNGDLHLAAESSREASFKRDGKAARRQEAAADGSKDHDGQKFDGATVGADEPGSVWRRSNPMHRPSA